MIGTTAAIIGASVIGAGASLASSSSASSAASKAAKTQAASADRAADLQHAQYLQTREDYAPWRTAGSAAVTRQADIMGLNGQPAMDNAFTAFRSDPGYGFTRDEAIKGVDRSAAARGLLNSGRTIKAIQERAASLADQSFGNWFNRYGAIAGNGQTATGGTAQAGANAAANQGDALMAGGAARASGYRDAANASSQGWGGAMSSVNQGLNNYFALNGLGGGGGGTLAPVASTPMNPYFAQFAGGV